MPARNRRPPSLFPSSFVLCDATRRSDPPPPPRFSLRCLFLCRCRPPFSRLVFFLPEQIPLSPVSRAANQNIPSDSWDSRRLCLDPDIVTLDDVWIFVDATSARGLDLTSKAADERRHGRTHSLQNPHLAYTSASQAISRPGARGVTLPPPAPPRNRTSSRSTRSLDWKTCRGPTLTARPSSGPLSSRPLSAPRRPRRVRRSSRMDRAAAAAMEGGRRGSRARRRSGASLRGWRQRLARTSRRPPANSRNSHNVGHRPLLPHWYTPSGQFPKEWTVRSLRRALTRITPFAVAKRKTLFDDRPVEISVRSLASLAITSQPPILTTQAYLARTTGAHLYHQARHRRAQLSDRPVASLHAIQLERRRRRQAGLGAQQERRHDAADQACRYYDRVQGRARDPDAGECASVWPALRLFEDRSISLGHGLGFMRTSTSMLTATLLDRT